MQFKLKWLDYLKCKAANLFFTIILHLSINSVYSC